MSTGGGGATVTTTTVAAQQLIHDLAAIPASEFDQVGAGSSDNPPKRIAGPALPGGGQPRVLYVGAEYCPFCAAERWAMATALSRFGTFGNVGLTHSSGVDIYPNTATLSFHHATFSSRYFSFAGFEMQSNEVVNGHYAPLDQLTTADQSLLNTFDSPPYVDASASGSIPFVYFGGQFIISGATYNPGVLQGLSQDHIVAALNDSRSAVAQAILGAANVVTASICQLTGSQPADVCSSPGVSAARNQIGLT